MRVLQFIAAIFVFIASPAFAKDGGVPWVVIQKSGHVQVIHPGMQPASVQLKSNLAPGDVVSTGVDGRAMLTRGGDYVIVAPGSRLLLPNQEQQASGFTRLIHQFGTMLYKVRHTGVPHFAVETPMLAAVVKGTSFTVIVDKDRAAVQVTEGVVEVSSAAGNARRLVEGGMTVYVGRERPTEIIEMKPGGIATPTTGTKVDEVKIERSGDVPLSSITGLTGGLVNAAPTAPVVAAVAPLTGGVDLLPGSGRQQPIVGGVTAPVVDVVDTAVPAIVDPVTDIVDTTVPAVIDPVVDVVDTTVPAIVDPVVDIVDTTIPAIVDPVVDIVETVLPVVEPVVTPVVNIVETTVPAIVEPIGQVVGSILGW